MYLNPANEQIAARQRIEVAIVTKVVDDALKAGYTLDVDDGGEVLAVAGATTRKAALDALLNTDEDKLILRQGAEYGVVCFVYGNDGWDVIADYTLDLEDVLAGANALAEKLEAENS